MNINSATTKLPIRIWIFLLLLLVLIQLNDCFVNGNDSTSKKSYLNDSPHYWTSIWGTRFRSMYGRAEYPRKFSRMDGKVVSFENKIIDNISPK